MCYRIPEFPLPPAMGSLIPILPFSQRSLFFPFVNFCSPGANLGTNHCSRYCQPGKQSHDKCYGTRDLLLDKNWQNCRQGKNKECKRAICRSEKSQTSTSEALAQVNKLVLVRGLVKQICLPASMGLRRKTAGEVYGRWLSLWVMVTWELLLTRKAGSQNRKSRWVRRS